MLLKIVIGLVVLIAVFLTYVALQPSDFKIERSTLISAPPATLFPYINNPRKFEEWNPWSKQDPSIKLAFAGPVEGVDAKSSWESSKMGNGSMTIERSIPNESVYARLDFLTPFKGTNYSEYKLTPEGDQTRVAWIMRGTSAFIPRIVCVFMGGMDGMMGGEFEKGLASLKTIAESKVN